jgi:dolichol-phosphate mannosyltransferase
MDGSLRKYGKPYIIITMYISVILPTFNEVDNIIPLINKIKSFIGHLSFQIIVVDDDSPDGTALQIKKMFGEQKWLKLIIRKKNPGLALSILEGIKQSSAELIIVMDTDFNHDPKEILNLLHYAKQFDMIIGSRYVKNGGMENRMRFYFSMLYNMIIKFVLGLQTNDNLSGFFLIKRSIFDKLPAEKIFIGYGDYFIRLLKFAKDNNLHMKEIPIYYKNRHAGKSKSVFLKMLFDYTQTLFSILKQ